MEENSTSTRSAISLLAQLSAQERDHWLSTLSPEEAKDFLGNWEQVHARPEQREPKGNWRFWLMLAGRGAGKTRAGAEWIRKRVKNGARRIAIVGRTAKDVRNVMVNGESGLISVCRYDKQQPRYYPGSCELRWPNGAVATTYSADEPNSRSRAVSHKAPVASARAR